MSTSFANISHGGRSSAPGNWGVKLATAPPAHLFETNPTATARSHQPATADDRGDPMIVDNEPGELQSGLPKSRWVAASTTTAGPVHGINDATNTTVSNMDFGRPGESRSYSVTDTTKANTPQPVASSRGLDASHWGKPASATAGAGAPSTPAAVSAVASGQGLGASNWGQSTSAATPAPGPANVATVCPQTTITSPTNMAETKVSGHSSKTTRGASDVPAIATTSQGAVAAGSDPSVEKSTNATNLTVPTGPRGPDQGLKKSRWATSAHPAKGQTTVMKPIFGKDPGRIVDNDWMDTYQVEDGGRIYSLAANNAREAGDQVAAMSLHNVAELSAEIVRARTMHQDLATEKQARDAANAAASLAVNAFSKYHPPHPKEIVRENTTFHSTDARMRDAVDGQPIRMGTAAQSRAKSVDHTRAPAPAGRTIMQASQPAAGFPASISAQHHNYSQHESRAVEIVDPPTRSFVAGELQNNTAHSVAHGISKPQPVQQQAQTAQQPPLTQDSIPSNFDDPRARQMLEDFFFSRGKN